MSRPIGQRCRANGARSAGQVAQVLLMLLLLLADEPLELVSCEYYARLAKLGPIRGVLVPDKLGSGGGGGQSVAGFLNIGYAAPPVGPLRLMPPGAAQTSRAGPLERARLLLPGLRRSPVRGHVQFGQRCVHLADWNLADYSGADINNLTANMDIEKRQEEALRANRRRQQQQSEDCLNLNVFVPINESQLPFDRREQTVASRQQREQIKSNYPAQGQQQVLASSSSDSPKTKTNAATPNGSIRSIRGEEIGRSTNRSDEMNQDNRDDGDLVNQADSSPADSDDSPLRPIGKQGDSPMPVLVLLHGAETSHLANTFEQLALVRRTQCILITFNYRLGLLGFLPYSDRSADGKSALPRNNYAIWDQIGLLHWVRRNVAAFNGNPNNVTLMAVDNQAALFVQLLVMSPLAKGLINRAVIVHDETRPLEVSSNLDQLLSMAGKTRDLRRQLAIALNQIVHLQLAAANQHPPSPPNSHQSIDSHLLDERTTFDYIQSASLEQLARLDHELRTPNGPANDQLLRLAFGPNLDDKLLFPYLGPLIRAGRLDFGQRGLANLTQSRAEATYCLYVSQLYANGSDPLRLIGSELRGLGSMSSKIQQFRSSMQHEANTISNSFKISAFNRWHRNPDQPKSLTNRASIYKRSVLAMQFNHLHNIHLLSRLLSRLNPDEATSDGGQITSREVSILESTVGQRELEDSDDDDDVTRMQQNRNILLHGDSNQSRKRSLNLSSDNSEKQESSETTKRSLDGFSPFDRFYEDREHLLAPLGSIDLMIGYIKSNATTANQDLNAGFSYQLNAKYNNIATALIEATGYNEQLLFLLRFAGLHFIASITVDDAIGHYCDFFAVNKTETPVRSSFVFLVDNEDSAQNSQDSESWLDRRFKDRDLLADGLVNFIKFGNPNNALESNTSAQQMRSNSPWPVYEPLNHNLNQFSIDADSTRQNSTRHLRTMDTSQSLKNLIQVHLDALPYLSLLNWSQLHQAGGNSSHSSEQIDLMTCLGEIDSAINRTRATRGHQSIFSSHLDDFTWRCLTSLTLRFQSHLRQYAADDLEHLNGLIRKQLINDPHSQVTSSITTRNLVDDGSMVLDSLDSQRQQNVQSEAGYSSEPTSVVTQISNKTSGIKSFLAATYKDAIGKALTIVVGTGLSIFLLNLLVILIVTWRSARTRRRASQADVYDVNLPDCMTDATGQPTKKSTLKKCNLQPVPDSLSTSLNGTTEGVQLTSAIRGNRCGAEHRSRQLKFDLSNVAADDDIQDSTFFMASVNDSHYELNHEQQITTDGTVLSNPIDNMVSERQVFEVDHVSAGLGSGQSVNCDTNAERGEILLRAEPLIKCYYENFDQSEPMQEDYLDLGQNPYELRADGLLMDRNQASKPSPLYQSNQFPAQSHYHHCGLNTSPITNQSFSTATTTTSTNLSSIRRHTNQCRTPSTQHPIVYNHKSDIRHQQHALYLDHSTASPSTSTTLSMTPIQLESVAAISGSTTNMQYQIEPIRLLYQPSNYLGQPTEEFLTDKMFLISSPDIAQPMIDKADQQRNQCAERHNQNIN